MITIRELHKSFAGREVLKSVTLELAPGKVYALTGESGSGKTTLLNILAKLETYDSGQVFYQGQDLKTLKAQPFYRDQLGYLFQNFGLIENLSISENLDLGLVGRKLSKAEALAQKKSVMQEVNLPQLDLGQKVFELSGGEAQRVALAKLFLKDPPLILADEPTASLDPDNARDVMDLLFSLKNDQRLIIIATHNPQVWERADTVIRMEDLT